MAPSAETSFHPWLNGQVYVFWWGWW